MKAQQSYHVTSQSDGEFRFAEVAAAEDYQLTVRSDGLYQDYQYTHLSISAAAVRHDIILQAAEFGSLSGQMVDVDAQPVPHFDLTLYSQGAGHDSLSIRGDAGGYFSVSEVAAGALTLSSRSQPYSTISGLTLAPGEHAAAILVLDWGRGTISGRLIDPDGAPVPAATVSLSWTQTAYGLNSRSLRQGVSDAQGVFSFSQLGTGEHMLQVDAAGFERAQRSVPVGVPIGDDPTLEVQLRWASP